MDWTEAQLSHARSPDVITHVGAGLCSELETYLLHNPDRICLVEPNPEALPKLRRLAAQDQRICVIPMAISDREDRQSLNLFNYPNLASLRQPTGLIQLLPGLRQTGQSLADVLAARDLPKLLKLEAEKDNWLIIDTPGEEFAIIDDLAKHEQLYYFDRIVLTVGAESFYQGAKGVKEIIAYLQSLGYFCENAPDNADPDWPRLHVRLSPKALECRRLERDNRKLQEQLEKIRETDAKQSRELALAQEDLEAIRQRLEATKKQQEEEQSQFETQLEAKEKRFEEQVAVLLAEKKELEQQCASLNKEVQQAKAEVEKHEDQMRADVARRDHELEAARAEIEKQRNDLGVALRLQSLREADLKELQKRFGELQQLKIQQQQLLGKLYQRLRVAADYLRLESDGSNPKNVRDELARALSGEREENK